jgi:hypothetical protein
MQVQVENMQKATGQQYIAEPGKIIYIVYMTLIAAFIVQVCTFILHPQFSSSP